MVENRFVTYNKSNNKIYSLYQRFITSPTIEGFFFAMVCSTVFVGSMFHLWWDIGYKYRVDEIKTIHWFSDFNFFAIIMLLIAVYYSVRKLHYGRTIKFDMALAILLQAFILVSVLDYHKQDYSVVKWAWILPTAYIIGKAVTEADPEHANERIEKVFFCLVVGMFIASAMDFYYNFKLEPVLGYLNTESWESFWFPGNFESRPTYEFGFVLVSSSCGYMIYKAFKKKSIILFIVTVFANAYVQYCVIKTEGRENRLLLPINLVLFAVLYIYDNYKDFSRIRKVIVKAIVAAFILLTVGCILAFKGNWFGLYDKYMTSNWADGGGILNNVRFQINREAFRKMLKYPTENWLEYEAIYVGREYHLSHSLALEYGRVYGVTVFGLIVIFRVLMLKDIFIFFIKRLAGQSMLFLIPASFSIIIYDMMEPNTYYHKRFWLGGLLICGIIRGLRELDRKEDM